MKPDLAKLVMRGPADPLLVKEVLRLEALVKVLQEEMRWRSGQPIDKGYYLCAIVGNSTPRELYWDGSVWSYIVGYDGIGIERLRLYAEGLLLADELNLSGSVDNNDVRYYMRLGDIPMPEGW